MLILPEFQRPYLLEMANSPVIAKSFWAFSGTMLDYKLFQITHLEETIGAAIKVEINGFEFLVPYNWYILISDPDTLTLDYIHIADCATTLAYALTMTPLDSKFRLAEIKIRGLEEKTSIVHPMLQKNTALCHPISELELDNKSTTIQCVVIGPYDLFKFINNHSYGDLL